MTRKQKYTQQNIQQSVDGVDNAVDLYRQFDAELDRLIDVEESNLINIDNSNYSSVSDSDVVQENTPSDKEYLYTDATDYQHGVNYDDDNVEKFVKGNNLSIEFRDKDGYQKRENIGTRDYNGSKQGENTKGVLHVKHAMQSVRPDTSAVDTQQISKVNEVAHTTASLGHSHSSMPVPQIKEYENYAPDLDTGAALGGRIALSTELQKKKQTQESVSGAIEKERRDVVRLSTMAKARGAMHSIKRHKKEERAFYQQEILEPSLHYQRHQQKRQEVPHNIQKNSHARSGKDEEAKENISRNRDGKGRYLADVRPVHTPRQQSMPFSASSHSVAVDGSVQKSACMSDAHGVCGKEGRDNAMERVNSEKASVPSPPQQALCRDAIKEDVAKPQLYQLERPVGEQYAEVPMVVSSHYVPKKKETVAPTQKEDEDDGKIVAVFDHVQDVDGEERAHALLGSRTFMSSRPRSSFAEIAQRIQDTHINSDEENDFPVDGAVTFTRGSREKESRIVQKSAENKNDAVQTSSAKYPQQVKSEVRDNNIVQEERATAFGAPTNEYEDDATCHSDKEEVALQQTTTHTSSSATIPPHSLTRVHALTKRQRRDGAPIISREKVLFAKRHHDGVRKKEGDASERMHDAICDVNDGDGGHSESEEDIKSLENALMRQAYERLRFNEHVFDEYNENGMRATVNSSDDKKNSEMRALNNDVRKESDNGNVAASQIKDITTLAHSGSANGSVADFKDDHKAYTAHDSDVHHDVAINSARSKEYEIVENGVIYNNIERERNLKRHAVPVLQERKAPRPDNVTYDKKVASLVDGSRMENSYHDDEKEVFLPGQKRSWFGTKTLVTVTIIIIAFILFGGALMRRGADIYTTVKDAAERGFSSLNVAVAHVKERDFDTSQRFFQKAIHDFGRANESFTQINSSVVAMTRYIPFLSKVASGKNAIDAGRHIAQAGMALSEAGKVLENVGNPLSGDVSLLKIYNAFIEHVSDAYAEISAAQASVDKIAVTDIPEKYREQFIELKEKLPIIRGALERFQDNSHIVADLLGANGPRKYLFLFQNNHEMRATGGFIGSYGRLDIAHGKVQKFFIDGIYNPDGQLHEKIIPPRPIQKISAAWSLHDSNWFPHFPTSAEEAIVFYERTGGPTVDGVIAITPVVLERLLEITGPIHLPAYETDITAKNFMERLQKEVEIDYDKGENKPKKILSDLAPLILSRVLSPKNGSNLKQVIDVFGQMLVEKHIQLYARNKEVEKWILDAGWGGAIADVPYDYLSVINTNINGFKTDGVIDETIYHWADIKEDGSIVDTVRVVRKHTGGHTPYEWWNKVNADYMRVFVPRGSRLISVSGQTREFVEPPLDYRALDFQSDPRVVEEEQGMIVDDKTGTRIYEQNNKTVFANWVYVSPQETVTIEYTYELPFRIRLAQKGGADTYSILFQKQAGSRGSRLISKINLPENMRYVWSYPQNTGDTQWKTTLKTDQLRGVVLVPSGQ